MQSEADGLGGPRKDKIVSVRFAQAAGGIGKLSAIPRQQQGQLVNGGEGDVGGGGTVPGSECRLDILAAATNSSRA